MNKMIEIMNLMNKKISKIRLLVRKKNTSAITLPRYKFNLFISIA